MTAPTPEQMRVLADDPKLIDVPLRTLRAALRSAADQLDGVRDEIADVLRAWDVMRGEHDRLRAVIAEAPHGWECAQQTYNGHDGSIDCTCWKADAL